MSAFKALRQTKQTKLRILAHPDTVFPLLCPVREYEWIEPWKCDVIYTDSGVAENNCIFFTDLPDRGESELWAVSRYEPNRCIEFVRFSPGEKIVKLDIHLSVTASSHCDMLWRKVFTGLSESGNRVVRTLADHQFEVETQMIEKMLNHYLQTGQRLAIS
jgi:hypothetical protein